VLPLSKIEPVLININHQINVVTLAQTQKQGFGRKEKLVSEVRECLEQFKHLFVVSTANMRNTKHKEVRMKFKDSRFFFFIF
jgi:mRNA turnover protein 4